MDHTHQLRTLEKLILCLINPLPTSERDANQERRNYIYNFTFLGTIMKPIKNQFFLQTFIYFL